MGKLKISFLEVIVNFDLNSNCLRGKRIPMSVGFGLWLLITMNEATFADCVFTEHYCNFLLMMRPHQKRGAFMKPEISFRVLCLEGISFWFCRFTLSFGHWNIHLSYFKSDKKKNFHSVIVWIKTQGHIFCSCFQIFFLVSLVKMFCLCLDFQKKS